MVVLSALPARDTDKPVPTNNTNRNTTKTAAGRWSVRKNLGLLSLGGGASSKTKDDEPAPAASPSASPPSSPPPAVVDHISEIHPASCRKKKREPVPSFSSSSPAAVEKTSTESNRSLETTNTTATAWSTGTFEYEPSDASSSGASSASSSPNPPSTFLQTYETNHCSANMNTSSGQSRRPSTSSSSSASGRRTVGTAGDVVRAIAQSAYSLGLASSTTTSTAEAGTGVPGSRSRTNSLASSSSPNMSTIPRPPALAERNVPRSTSDGSNVIHARIRRRYSNPDLPNMAASASAAAADASASLASAGTAPATTLSRGGIRSEHTRMMMPRRSSLKKVSSYGPEAGRRSSSNSGTISSSRRRTNASSSAAPTGMSRRRHSMVDLTTAGQDVQANNQDETNDESLRNQRRTRRSTSLPTIYKEVTFDSAVSYATISYVHDICPKAPERLFYADEDYHRMKGAIRADVKQIKLETKKRQEQKQMKETEKQRYYSDKYMDGTPRNVKTSSYLPSYEHDDYGEEEVESDSDLCNWGIEHYTCSKAERQERSERARSVINSVLWKQSIIRQSKSSSDLKNPDLVDTITSKLARTSIKASQVARIQAVERATRVEFHCSKIIDRRHSEGDAKYGARILDGLPDSEDEGIEAGKVKDASLDEVVGRRRPAYRKRASLA